MELTQIRYFLALARTLNFTRAAEACNVTQPALTKSIQRLEAELGGPLLLRERSFTQLTPLGTEMLPLLEQTHEAARRAMEHAAGFKDRRDAPLRIGIAADAPLHPFAPLLAELHGHLPCFGLVLAEDTGPALFDALLGGALDVGIVTGVALPPERLHRWRLFQDRVVLLTPPGHRLAGPGPVPDGALAGEPAACVPADRTDTVFEGRAFATPAARFRTATPARAMELSQAGLGVALATEWAEAGMPRRPFAGQPAHDVLLVAVAGRPMTTAMDLFIKLARARAWGSRACAMTGSDGIDEPRSLEPRDGGA